VPRRPPAPARPDAIVVSLEDQRALAAYVAMARARRGRPLPGLIASTTDDAALAAPPPIDIPPIETPPLPEPAGLLPGTRSDS
jgi:hypothetical protein